MHVQDFKLKLRGSSGSLKALLSVGVALAVMLSVLLYPLGKSFYISFTDRLLGYDRYSFIGLDNYSRLIHDSMFWHALWNSAKLTVANVIGSLVVGLGLALLLNSKVKTKGLFTTLLFLPWAVASTVTALVFRLLYNDMYGYVSYMLMRLHITSESINLLARPYSVWPAMLIPIIWMFYPFVTLIFLAALQSIDRTMYEAAAMDGASRWQTFRHVTLPSLKPVIVIQIVLLSIWSFSAFDMVALLTAGGPGYETMTLGVYIYKQGHEARLLGYACALGAVTFIVLLAFTMLFLWLSRRSKLYED
jgi:multiple sugar transport system permease protein